MFQSPLASELYNYTALWTFFLIFVRAIGLFLVLPGIGGTNTPSLVTILISLSTAGIIAMSGVEAIIPQSLAEAILMIGTELLLGAFLGAIPLFIISSLAVAGQITAGAIGLAQANQIDPSLGEAVSLVARVQTLIGVTLFLMIDGHHVLIRALAGTAGGVAVGLFRPNMDTAMLFADRFREMFELAVLIAAPVLVALLVTNFVLGLITRSVPQVNIFVISLPLTLGIGLYLIAFTFPGLKDNLFAEFTKMESATQQLLAPSTP